MMSLLLALLRNTTLSLATRPMAEMEITNPEEDEVVSPPTKSTLKSSHAARMPLYNASTASSEKRLLIPSPMVICSGFPFMAAMSDTFTDTAL